MWATSTPERGAVVFWVLLHTDRHRQTHAHTRTYTHTHTHLHTYLHTHTHTLLLRSTLLGVLTHNVLDNGRGLSRQKLFRHQHEMDTGRTSSVSYNILGFDSKGSIVNNPSHDSKLDWVQICTDASKVTTFIDLAGHERYLKTTVFGLTGHAPHYAMLMIGSNAGIVGMTKGE